MDYLLNVVWRSTLLAAAAGACAWRFKSAAAKHAVWTLAAIGMLIQFFLGPLLPSLSLPVLKPVEITRATQAQPAPVSGPPTSLSPASHAQTWPEIAMAIYAAGVLLFTLRLAAALWFTRRLLRSATRIGAGQYESRAIAIPVTIGSRILLPMTWREWDQAKLRAALAHESAHVKRRDWAIALLARVNRCLLWFHPLAWWVERELARLAELACDDAALAGVPDRQQYAQALLDMAQTVRIAKRRLLTAGMAKETNVETRINRILDETRRIPKAFGRGRWAALLLCGAPLLYFVAAGRLAPAQTLMAIPAPAAPPAPRLLVQAAPPPAPPAQPVAPAPPAPPNPPAPAVQNANDVVSDVNATIEELNQRLAEMQMRMRSAQDAQAQAQARLRAQERTTAMAQIRALQAQLAALVRQGRQRPNLLSDLTVSVSPQRTVTLSLPLGESAQYDVAVQILDENGAVVANARDKVAASSWTGHFTLNSGEYHFKGTFTKAGGQPQTRDLTFQVE